MNYDLCFEKNIPEDKLLETGFSHDSIWNDIVFSENQEDNYSDIFLYKLHGSIDWQRKNDNTLIKPEHRIGLDKPEVIFGTDFKLRSIDPYLFYIHEFRKYLLDCKLIIVIGFSFLDSHINNLLVQALQHSEYHNNGRKIIYVNPSNKEQSKNTIMTRLKWKDGIKSSQFEIIKKGAKDFLEKTLNADFIAEKLPDDTVVIF